MIADLPTASANSSRQFEAIFDCAARTPKFACSKDARLKDQLPSTKGLL
jgi:imidazoleglycerol-phosphate dehydratase